MKRRNGKIELLRFMFSVWIMLCHSDYFAADGAWSIAKRGALGVEFFFMLSGYLMVCSVKKKEQIPSENLGKETSQFILHKITALMPNFVIAWVIGLAVMHYRGGDYSLTALIKRAIEGTWELTFLTMAGFGKVRVNVDWYISAMILAMVVLYPLCRRYFSVFVHILAPTCAAFILGCFYYTSLTPTNVMQYYDVVYKGMLRAVADICLGAACYPAIEGLKQLKLMLTAKKILSVIEGSIWIVVFGSMLVFQNKTYDFFVMLLIVAGTILSFGHQGVYADAFDRPSFLHLGIFSLSLYLGHSYWANLLERKYMGLGYAKLMVIYVILAFGTALIIHLSSAWLKKKKEPIFAFLKEKFLANS